ncbi:hypothetical protein LG314_11780 [Agrococcus terreus]|uniref:hypothetical protein n=1 Tax=Agrococcus terreus TaxID=574649 RepID=UPI00384D23B2
MTENSSFYRGSMPPTPVGGHDIRDISGEAATIIARGRTMETLGDRMQEAANTLKHLADGTVGAGLSIDELRNDAEEVYADLKTAGRRYSPSGAAVRAYGEALDDAQTAIRPVISDCEALWTAVRSASWELERAEEDQESSKQSTFDQAVTEWEQAASRYDGPYEAWDAAYDAARQGLEDANEDGVRDSGWDDFIGVLDTVVTVLGWIGVALVIAAVIIGGPIVAAIAVVVGVVALLGTIILACEGRKTTQDVIFAGLSIVPFGKLVRLGPMLRAVPAGTSRIGATVAHLGDDFVQAFRGIRNAPGAAADTWRQIIPRAVPNLNQATLGTQAIMTIRELPGGLPGTYANAVRRLGGLEPGQLPTTIPQGLAGMADAMFGNVLPTVDTIANG